MTPSSQPAANGRPWILIVSHGLTGHLTPMMRISSALHSLGWTVYFLGPTAHQSRISSTGAVFVPLSGAADLDDKAYYEQPPTPDYASLHWAERVLIDLREQCLEPLPQAWSCVQGALRAMRADDPGREVVVLAEAFFYGILPLRRGAPVPGPRPRSLCVSVTVPAIRAPDLPPCGYPFPFDGSAAGRERNARLWRSWERKAAPLTALLRRKLREAGAAEEEEGGGGGGVFLSGENYVCHERILQLGVPGFEYPRAEWPPGFRFVGLVQGEKKRDATTQSETDKDPGFPWWPDVLANSASLRGSSSNPARKKIVVVAQGTVETNPQDLIIPTIRAFADPASASKVLVVAILGWKHAKLTSLSASSTTTTTTTTTSPNDDDDDAIPPNAYVADYLAYDAALRHADAWVHNGGFGAVSHGIAHGVPMVVAGEGMDKTENAARVAWSGAGVDLGCARPAAAAVREAVERVLGGGGGGGEEEEEQQQQQGEDIDEREDGRGGGGGGRGRGRGLTPRQRVEELRRESEAIDCFRIIHEELLGVAGLSGSSDDATDG